MKEFICAIESDSKLVDAIKTATAQLSLDFDLNFVQKNNLQELDQYLSDKEHKDQKMTLLILSRESLTTIDAQTLSDIQKKYNSYLILTVFEDPLRPLKKTETWPVENIIYKPFDPAILQEHLRFALIKNEKIKTTAVHSSSEKNYIEKIRRQNFLQLSEFGFTIETTVTYTLNQPYKFYHLSFVDQKKSSQWVKPISKTDHIYEFIFCAPTTSVTTILRQKGAESKNKLKTAKWSGFEKNKTITEPKIVINMNETEDFEKLKDYFSRKFKKAHVFQIPEGQIKDKLDCDLLISEKDFSAEQINTLFKNPPMIFRITSDSLPQRTDIEKLLSHETVRLPKPLDRNYFGRMFMSYFPNCIESDSTPANWFPNLDPALHSEMIEVSELSEAAFTYQNEIQFKRGDYQEFALTQDDENELRPIKSKIQFVDTTPDADKKYLHQIVFFGIRDDLLKKLRLWMLQTHIDHKKSGS